MSSNSDNKKRCLIDLFCGIGGVSHGFSQMGFDVVLAMDIWEPALEVHTSKHPNTVHSKIPLGSPEAEQYIIDTITELGLVDGDHLHIHGSPPCQQLSIVNTTRDVNVGMILMTWTHSLLTTVKEHITEGVHYSWTIEQVSNPVVKQFAAERNISYSVYTVSDYGVCQKRKRLIMSSHDIENTMKTECLDTCGSIETYIELPEGTEYVTNTTYGPNRAHNEKFMPRIAKYVPSKTISYTVIQKPNWFLGKNQVPIRAFSWHENMLLQTFPNDYIDTTTMRFKRTDLYKMVANAVPPNFAKCLAKAHIIKSTAN